MSYLEKYFTMDSVEVINIFNQKRDIPDSKLFTDIINIYKSIDRNPSIKISNQRAKHKMNNNVFISSTINKEILNLPDHTIIEIDNLIINVYSYNEKINIDRLYKIYQVISRLVGYQKKIIINIYLTDFKKYLDITDNCIGPDHVNSGSTDGETIQIWRKEELYKVLIHELLHVSRIECDDLKIIDKKLHQLFNISKSHPILLSEAYVETLATIINCLIISCEMYKENDKIIKMTKYLLCCEISFGIYQTQKIIKFFGFTNMSDFLTKSNKYINQKSNVFSYYIIKASLLFRLPDFLTFINHQIKFPSRISKIHAFSDMIIRSLYKKNFIISVDNCIESYSLSMRMTVAELKWFKDMSINKTHSTNGQENTRL